MQLDLFPKQADPQAREPDSNLLPREPIETAVEILARLIAQSVSQSPASEAEVLDER